MSTKDSICRCLPCICDALHDCEDRVLEAAAQRKETLDTALDTALDAVRKAVASLPQYALIGTSLMVILLIVLAWTQ